MRYIPYMLWLLLISINFTDAQEVKTPGSLLMPLRPEFSQEPVSDLNIFLNISLKNSFGGS